MKIVEKIQLVMVDTEGNSNKFWRGTLFDNNDVLCEWGRIGKKEQNTRKPSAGKRFLDTKVREKEKKGYKVLNTINSVSTVTASNEVLKKSAKNQIKTKSKGKNKKLVDNLIALLLNENIHAITSSTNITYNKDTGLFSTPLGIVTKNTVNKARKHLSKIEKFVISKKFDGITLRRELAEYLMLIPRDIGMKKPVAIEIFPDIEAIHEQSTILDKLEVSFDKYEEDIAENVVEEENIFNLELDVAPKSIFDYVNKKYKDTRKGGHVSKNLKVKQVYIIKNKNEEKNFEKDSKNIMELWHGSSKENLLSILNSGIRISPPSTARIAGKMFGNGAYFASDSTKSLNYSYGYWHGRTNNNCFMFLADIAMGNFYIPPGSVRSSPPKGYDSYWAKGRDRNNPRKRHSGVMNDEFIVFRNSQIKLKYLVEFA